VREILRVEIAIDLEAEIAENLKAETEVEIGDPEVEIGDQGLEVKIDRKQDPKNFNPKMT
jgi:hypothetical protein